MLKVTSIVELKELLTTILLSRTDRVSKVSEGSVLNGILFGAAKLGQKTMKDIAIIESRAFPDSAYGVYLDEILEIMGLPDRFGASGSSTYVRIEAQPGTVYLQGSVISGGEVDFTLQQTVNVGSIGIAYAPAVSVSVGATSNIQALSISRISPQPSGHLSIVNEYGATGGRDVESDEDVRSRIKNFPNIAATNTLSSLEQVLKKEDNNVLRLFNAGTASGALQLKVLAQNGANFNQATLNIFNEKIREHLSISDLSLNLGAVQVTNMTWTPVDISARLRLRAGANVPLARRNIQVRLNKYFDYRKWQFGQTIEWDDLLQIVKSTSGVDYVVDSSFFPGSDIQPDEATLPRLRGFEIRNIDNSIIFSVQEQLNPVFYPSDRDIEFINTFLQ